jgi:hypothetical protein
MDGQNDRELPRSRVKRGVGTFTYMAIGLVVLFFVIFYLYLLKDPSTSPTSAIAPAGSTAVVGEAPLTEKTAAETPQGRTEPARPDQPTQQPGEGASSLEGEVPGPAEETLGELAGLPAAADVSDQIEQQLSAGGDYQRLIAEVNAFYAHLEQQPYMKSFALQEASKVYFSKLVQKLVDNPPVVHRETDDLFTLLQNTAHFFRILGKDNMHIAQSILDREKNSFEQVVKAFYGLTYQPISLKQEYALSIPPEALTDYAAFFLNTMGGRLYLFRRDSTLRMLVNYYAILTIDRANKQGNGGHGIDLNPAILSLIEEIDNGGNRLQQKDQYLEVLYDLQEKYN